MTIINTTNHNTATFNERPILSPTPSDTNPIPLPVRPNSAPPSLQSRTITLHQSQASPFAKLAGIHATFKLMLNLQAKDARTFQAENSKNPPKLKQDLRSCLSLLKQIQKAPTLDCNNMDTPSHPKTPTLKNSSPLRPKE